jgi:hypothetical protein
MKKLASTFTPMLLSIMVVIAFSCSLVQAQAPQGAPAGPPPSVVTSGNKEVSFNGTLNFGIGDNVGTSTGAGNILFGYYLNRNIEVGAGLFFDIMSTMQESADDGDPATEPTLTKSTSGILGPVIFGRYNIHTGTKSLTYFGLEMGVQAYRSDSSDNEKTTNDWLARPHLGFKHFFKKNVAFDANFGYKIIASSIKNSVQRSDSIDIRLGLAMVF